LAGIYIHIPFCRQLCYYCDFYFSISLEHKSEMVNALMKEIEIQKEYLEGELIETIYFGGGTPSVLNEMELSSLLEEINRYHTISKTAEITIETNPDDLSKVYLTNLRIIGFNRLSVGIQSFRDENLKFMNRRHDSFSAIDSVKKSQDCGFDNINIDLIYGLPGLTNDQWLENLEETRKLGVQHISAYHLTIEPKTVFGKYQKMNRIKPVDEDTSVEQFKTLVHWAKQNNFVHYEISNFAKEGKFSRHNSNYWKQKKYLGIGPSAHSFNLLSRQWNVAHNLKYISMIQDNNLPCQIEILDNQTKYNDYVLTSFRTIWGIDLGYLEKIFGNEYAEDCLNSAKSFIETGLIDHSENKLLLSDEGKMLADKIIMELFRVGK
jgi:oxygen-independent coproporphyrinogen III oxidase